MSPLWDDGDDEDDEDEDDDEKVDALIGAFLGDYSKGPWKWSKRDFADEGFKVSNVTVKRRKVDDVVEGKGKKRDREESDEGKGKKRAREESDEEDDEVEDVAPVMGDVKRHFDKCFRVLTAEMLNVFHQMDQNFKALSDQVKSLDHKVDKLRKRQRTGTVGQQQAANAVADEDGGVTPKKDTAKLTPPKETSPPKPSPTVTPPKESPPKDTSPKKPSPTVTPPKESPPKQTSQEETSPKGHPAEEDTKDADKVAEVDAEKGKGLEDKPAEQMLYEDSSSSVQNYATDPSVEEVFVPTDKVKQMQRSILKQEVKKDAALKEIRAKQVRIKFGERSDKPPLGTGQSSRVAPSKVPGRGYDPFAPVSKAKAAALIDFQKETGFPKRPKGSASNWYHTMKTHKSWLSDSQIDAALNMLRGRYINNPSWFRSNRIAFVDTVMPAVWMSHYVDFKASSPNADGSGKLLPPNAWDLFKGEAPEKNQSKQHWMTEVDDVYMPLHVNGNHWVACLIQLKRRHITIWDSIITCSRDSVIDKAIEPVAVMLPHVILALYHDENYFHTLERFTHERVKSGIPQNVVPGDCGVFAIKFIECHALGIPFNATQLCDENMKDIRAKLAAEIYDETKATGREDGKEWECQDLYDPKKK